MTNNDKLASLVAYTSGVLGLIGFLHDLGLGMLVACSVVAFGLGLLLRPRIESLIRGIWR